MDYKKYIDKFETAEAIQTALDNGELNKPYIAQVSGDGYNYIDWNSLEPTPLPVGQ